MGCCGQGRAALRAASTAARERPDLSRAAHAPGLAAHAPGLAPPTVGGPPAAVVRYLGAKPVRVRGTVSGRLYEFTGGAQMAVAASDVPALVRTGLFLRS